MATESREVSNFDRVHLQDFGDLDITQSAQESLTVEADEEILDKIRTTVRDGELILRIGGDWLDRLGALLSTSLTRPHVQYHLTVKDLTALIVSGAARVDVGDLTTEHLTVSLSGAGDVTFKSVTADRFEVKLTGAGRVDVSGRVKQQSVNLSGAGKYAGGKLESQRTRVTMSGAGSATVWANDELDSTLSGLGSVEYYGDPKVKTSISGLGSIKHLGSH
jgi:hypothetical protein